MNNLLTGKVVRVLDTVSGDSKRNPGQKWFRQTYVIETLDVYPRNVAFSIFGEDRIQQANIQLGEVITIEIEINSREYEGRWYTDVQCRNVFRGAEAQQMQTQQNLTAGMPNAQMQQGMNQTNFGPNTPTQASPGGNVNSDPNDDLPF